MSLRSKPKKKKAVKVCRTVVDRRTRRRRRVCRPVKRSGASKPVRTAPPKPAPVPKPAPGLPVPSAAGVAVTTGAPAAAPPPAAPPPAPAPEPPRLELPAPPTPVVTSFGRREAERLLWRAGFGPRPGDADRLAGRDPREVVRDLTRPAGQATLTGPEPHDQDGNPLDPAHVWGHDHLWWMDRMIRSDQQLVERMTLIWHDWFATSRDGVDLQSLMLDQNQLFRAQGLGSFLDLAQAVTKDPAMLVWLNGIDNRKGSPNENYARELMELFTLGADRGAYTEADVRELARALTGWTADWDPDLSFSRFRFDDGRHDAGTKTLWSGTDHERSGAFDWQDAVRLCVEHPLHPSFFVRKLWSYFVPSAPDAGTQATLEELYRSSGFQIRPIVEAILLHPDLYGGAPMVKPPAVFVSGMLRLRGRAIDWDGWWWACSLAGQQLFHPPNVAGWNDQAWLDTSTVRGRWYLAYWVLNDEYLNGWDPQTPYSTTETPSEALDKAFAFWDGPALSPESRTVLETYAAAAIDPTLPSWCQGPYRAYRQNALRHLIATCPDVQTC